jgi:hypothetical protein
VALSLSEPLYGEVVDTGLILAVCMGILAVLHLYVILGTTESARATRAAKRLVAASIFSGLAATIYSLHLILVALGPGCTWWDDFVCFYVPGWIPVAVGLLMVAVPLGFYSSIRKSGTHM